MERAGADLILPCAICIAVLVYLSFAPALFNDGDTSWHLAAGRWMIEAGSIPRVDPFSFTHAGQPWTAHEWLAELLMAGAFRLGSWGGLSLLFATSAAATLWIVALQARRLALPSSASAALILALFIVLAPFIVARPHVLAWPLLALWAILMLRAREAGRSPPLSAALLMLLWANLHGSFLFGLLMILPFALEALVADRARMPTIIGWGAFFILSLVAAIATPHGIDGLRFPLAVSRMESLPLIMEWRATDLTESVGFALVLAGMAAFALYRRLRIPPVRLLFLGLLLLMAFAHVRHQALLGIIGSLLLIEPLAQSFGAKTAGGNGRPLPRSVALVIAGSVLLVWAVRLPIDLSPGDSGSNPRTAIAHIPAALRNVPVLNGYGFGGPLILDGIRPFIDGRADLYGDAHMFEHQRIISGDRQAFERALQQWGIGWTILPPDSRLAARLDREPGWRRIHADRWAVIHVADVPAAAGSGSGASPIS